MNKNEDWFARRLFGESAQIGSIRLMIFIAAFTLVGGTFFWWIGRY